MKIHAPNATLVRRHDWAEGLASFFVQMDDGNPPAFVPGQFARLGLPVREDGTWDNESGAAIARAYSIASPPGDDALEFCIRRVPGEGFTPKLFALVEGDPIWLEPRAQGKFTLDRVPDAEELVLVCTGTGIAPFRSMLADARTRKRFGRVVLIYGARHEAELSYDEEFRAMAARDDGFTLVETLTSPAVREDWDGYRGRVHQFFDATRYRETTGHELTSERCQVLLCGNPAMIEEATAHLVALGLRKHRRREPGQIHTERYW